MDQKTKTYEGMFLLEAGQTDFQTASEPVRTVLARSEAEILSINPWDERRLAYEIGKHRRGLYALVYFKADPARLSEIEHDCQLDERILRAMILRRDRITDEEINAETPAMAASRRSRETIAERERLTAAKAAEAEAAVEGETQTDAKPAEEVKVETQVQAEPQQDAEKATAETQGQAEPQQDAEKAKVETQDQAEPQQQQDVEETSQEDPEKNQTS